MFQRLFQYPVRYVVDVLVVLFIFAVFVGIPACSYDRCYSQPPVPCVDMSSAYEVPAATICQQRVPPPCMPVPPPCSQSQPLPPLPPPQSPYPGY
jgi:hypothetical protein